MSKSGNRFEIYPANIAAVIFESPKVHAKINSIAKEVASTARQNLRATGTPEAIEAAAPQWLNVKSGNNGGKRPLQGKTRGYVFKGAGKLKRKMNSTQLEGFTAVVVSNNWVSRLIHLGVGNRTPNPFLRNALTAVGGAKGVNPIYDKYLGWAEDLPGRLPRNKR